MSIASSSVNIDSSPSFTGGTATTLKTKDNSDGRTHIVFLDDGADLLSQKTAEFSYLPPKVQASAPNGYTQARNKVRIKAPFVLDNGERTTNTITIEVACDYEVTAAERLTLLNWAAQILLDSDYTEFWDDQSIA
jgi:hypothetical protein